MRTLLVASTLIALAACGSKSEPAGPPPTADAVLEADLEATGGRAAWTAVKTMRVRGSLKVKEAGIEGTFTALTEAPNRTHVRLDLGAAGSVEEGCDGKVAWEREPGQPVKLATGHELSRELREAAIKSLDWRTEYDSIEMAGAATFAGRPAWKVVATMPGLVKTMYFDRSTKLNIGEEREESDRGQTSKTILRLSDYRTYGTVKQAATIEMVTGNATLRLSVDEVELNAALPAGIFSPPAAEATR